MIFSPVSAKRLETTSGELVIKNIVWYMVQAVWLVYAAAVFILGISAVVLFGFFIGLLGLIGLAVNLVLPLFGLRISFNRLQIAWHGIIRLARAAVGSGTIVHAEHEWYGRFNAKMSTILAGLHGSTENLFDAAWAAYYLHGPHGWVFKEGMGHWVWSWLTLSLRLIGGVIVINRADRADSVQRLSRIRLGSRGTWTTFIDGTRAGERAFHNGLGVIAKLFERGYLPLSALREWDLTLCTPRHEGLLAMMQANPDSNDVLVFSTYRNVPKESSVLWQLLLMTLKPFTAHVWLVSWNRRDLGWTEDGQFDRTAFGAGLIKLVQREVFPRLREHGVATAYELGYRAPQDLVKRYPQVWNADGTLRAAVVMPDPDEVVSVSSVGGSAVDEANYGLVEGAPAGSLSQARDLEPRQYFPQVDLRPGSDHANHPYECTCATCEQYRWS